MRDSKYRWIPLLCLLLFTPLIRAQKTLDADLTPSQQKKAALHAIRENDYFSAIDYLEKYLSGGRADYKLTFELAEMYRLTRDYEKALNEYRSAYNLNPNKNIKALYYLGRMQMTGEYYPEAIETFSQFRKEYRDEKDAYEFRKLAKNWIEGCELAMADTLHNKKIQTEHLSNQVNMAYNEVSPYQIDANRMYFSSLRSDTIIHYDDSLYQDTSIHRSVLYEAEQKSGKWQLVGKVNGPFEYNDAHVGNACYSLDSSMLYFTICRQNWKYEIICHIYASKWVDGNWSAPEKLNENINSAKYSSTQPSVGLNPRNGNEILFFSSNNPEGRGGFDLWYSERRDGDFYEARNLGGRINSDGDEVTPYFDRESSTLYFSSNGHPSYGEFDIFRSFGNKSKWMKNPENLGKPFNSPADDLYYNHGNDPKHGFFTSNRKGGIALKNPTCCDDIYAFEYDEIKRYTYKAVLVSDDKEIKVTSGDVQLFLRDPESNDTTYMRTVSIKKDGSLNIRVEKDLNYLLIIESADHFIEAVEIPPPGASFDFSVTDSIQLTKLTDRSFRLENIYYDFDDWRLTDKAMVAIDSFLLKILKLNPEIKVEISSHTDAKGSGEYNIRLSQKRAESVVQYLRKKGISSSRMVAKGYGKTKPIAPNTNPDGSDNPEGRQLNRRTEFRVIGFEEKVKYKKIPTNKYAR